MIPKIGSPITKNTLREIMKKAVKADPKVGKLVGSDDLLVINSIRKQRSPKEVLINKIEALKTMAGEMLSAMIQKIKK